MSIHDQIRALCARAETKAEKIFERKLATEKLRHDERLREIHAERDLAVRVARAALPPDDATPANPPPDEVPAALREPWTPRQKAK